MFKFLRRNPSFIGTYMFDDVSFLDDIIQFFKDNPQKHHVGTVINLETGEGGAIRKDIKDSQDMTLLDLREDLIHKYLENLKKCCEKYREEYFYTDSVAQWGIVETPNIQLYAKNGGYFKYHCERGHKECARHLVFMTYLNDVKDAGETEFYYQKIKIKPKKGLTVIWPSDWTHMHRGIPSKTEEKCIITGWYSYM